MGLIEALLGGLIGSAVSALIAIADNQRRQKERIAKDAEAAVNLARDLNHIKRDIASYSQAFQLVRQDLEDNRKFLRKLVVRLAPELLDDVI